ncbi:MAG: glycerol kinase GlpK [Pseudomonadota bacterium]|nr:glycerol kinase GlpK [Pseudomonadota bacterium]
MTETLLLALDQGTTSTRAALYGLDGRERAAAGRPLVQHYPADGWVEHDPEEIAAASIAVIREVLERAKGDALGAVAALGLTNQRQTTIVWDRDTGRAIAPAIVWQDRRTAAECARLAAAGAEPEIRRKTTLPLDPYFSATKIAWLLDHVEGARPAAEAGRLAFGTVDAWLVWRLTGGQVHATDATNAACTSLYDLERGGWDEGLCRLFRVPASLLPEVRATADDYGLGDAGLLGTSLPIRACVGDQQAALMGQGCVRAGEIKCTYGTGAFMLLHTGEALVRSSSGLLSGHAARLAGRDTYAVEGSVFIAGAAVQWAAEAFGVEGGPAGVERLARGAREDHAVVLVPAFTGLGAPWWDSGARGALVGMTRDTGLAEIAAAAIDSAAHQTGDILEAMRADFPDCLPPGAGLRIDGGMASSPAFAQRLADLTGVPVDRADYTETTALGAAMFAGLGAGVFETVEAASALRPQTERFTPALPADQRQAARGRWLEAVGRVVSRQA